MIQLWLFCFYSPASLHSTPSHHRYQYQICMQIQFIFNFVDAFCSSVSGIMSCWIYLNFQNHSSRFKKNILGQIEKYRWVPHWAWWYWAENGVLVPAETTEIFIKSQLCEYKMWNLNLNEFILDGEKLLLERRAYINFWHKTLRAFWSLLSFKLQSFKLKSFVMNFSNQEILSSVKAHQMRRAFMLKSSSTNKSF